MKAIKLENVSFSYQKNRMILKAVNMEVNKGEIVGIVGPSGEGKTTLIRLINGTLHNSNRYDLSGTVEILGDPIINYGDMLTRHVGTVYQNPDNQLIFTNVVDEIVFGMENHEYNKKLMDEKLEKVLRLLDIKHLTNRNPSQLSGGEKQLIVLASILCLDVEILLLDEAFAAVDSEREPIIIKALQRLAETGTTIIMVEHDMSHLNIASRVYHLEDGMLQLLQ